MRGLDNGEWGVWVTGNRMVSGKGGGEQEACGSLREVLQSGEGVFGRVARQAGCGDLKGWGCLRKLCLFPKEKLLLDGYSTYGCVDRGGMTSSTV